MKLFKLRTLWGLLSFGIYLALVALVWFYFNVKSKEKKQHYVKKNDDVVQVALAAPKQSSLPEKKKKTKKKKPQKKVKKTQPKKQKRKQKKLNTKKKTESKKQLKRKKRPTKNVSKKNKKVKKRDTNRTRTKKKQSAKSLFASVKTPRKPMIKITDKPVRTKPTKQLFTMVDAKAHKDAQHSLKKQRRKERGVENAYLAKVQRMLEDWPSQSDFAGEKVKVYLKIRPDGYFTFEFKQKANNPAFNEALRAYLEQLQTIGFGPHEGRRTYLFEAEFVAKD
jgi:protein TonB